MSARLPVVTSQEGSASLTSLARLCDNRRCEETLFHQVTPPKMFCNNLIYHKHQRFAYTDRNQKKRQRLTSFCGHLTYITRMHSSGMRTVRSLTICRGLLSGGYAPGGCQR